MKDFLEYTFIRLLARIVQSVSLSSARRVARGLAAFFFHVIPIRKTQALDNLRRAFPEKTKSELRAIVHESYQNFFLTFVELMWTPHLNDDMIEKLVSVENEDRLSNAAAKGHGVILLSAHFGNWEWLAYMAARFFQTSIVIIAQAQKNVRVDRMINALRTRNGNRIVDMKMGVREIVGALRSRGIVAMLSDQAASKESIYVDFFGRPAATYQGPANLALKYRIPIVMVFCIRQPDDRYIIKIHEIPSDDLKDASEVNIRELTTRHVALLEQFIREHPGHWLWMHRRWKHQPTVDSRYTSHAN